MKRLLVQTQLSNVNYAKKNRFDLACDSGWQMVLGRVRTMLQRNRDLEITVMGPRLGESEHDEQTQVVAFPYDVNPELWSKYGHEGENRLHYIGIDTIPNALVTRFDFDWTSIAIDLDLGMQKIGRTPKWDAVYINDPMHLRNFMAMFHVVGGYQPKFYVHSHFVDVPEVPKFPKEASLWLGQCEAALKADYNFWQCDSAMRQFFDSMGKWFTQDVVDDVRAKSMPWDDGYSMMETTEAVDEEHMRFSPEEWQAKTEGKVILFFPNRISPSSNDYTNGMRFMFELLPKLRAVRDDFVVVCGNPNQKFTNKELEEKCGKHGYVSLVPDTFDRNEYKYVGRHADIALGLYDQDPYGGTAARELVELGCVPLWLDNYEYSSLAEEAGTTHLLAKADFSDFLERTNHLIDACKKSWRHTRRELTGDLVKVVRNRCSYEMTTPKAMLKMGLLPE